MTAAAVYPIMTTKASKPQELRNVLGDTWIDPFANAIRIVLNRQVREATQRIADGMQHTTTQEMIDVWAANLFLAQSPYVLKMAADGYDLGKVELGQKSLTDYWAKRQQVLVGGTPEDFLLASIHEPVAGWLREVSQGSAGTNAKRIDAIHKRAAAESESIREITETILEQGIVATEAHAVMIATTNTTWSYNEGAMRSYRDAGVQVKEWFTALDDRTCTWCSGMHGNRITIGNAFWAEGDEYLANFKLKDGSIVTRSLTFPAGIEHPPLHPRCRCILLPVLAGFLPVKGIRELSSSLN